MGPFITCGNPPLIFHNAPYTLEQYFSSIPRTRNSEYETIITVKLSCVELRQVGTRLVKLSKQGHFKNVDEKKKLKLSKTLLHVPKVKVISELSQIYFKSRYTSCFGIRTVKISQINQVVKNVKIVVSSRKIFKKYTCRTSKKLYFKAKRRIPKTKMFTFEQ